MKIKSSYMKIMLKSSKSVYMCRRRVEPFLDCFRVLNLILLF